MKAKADEGLRRTMTAERKYKALLKAAKLHAESVRAFLATLDALMRQPSTQERGKKIAELCNRLEMANDGLRYSELGIDFRKDKPLRPSEQPAAQRPPSPPDSPEGLGRSEAQGAVPGEAPTREER